MTSSNATSRHTGGEAQQVFRQFAWNLAGSIAKADKTRSRRKARAAAGRNSKATAK